MLKFGYAGFPHWRAESLQSGIRDLFHPEMGCAKASVRCPRCTLGAQKLPRCAPRCTSGAQKLSKCTTRCAPGAQNIPRCATWGTPGAQKNPRGAKNDKVVQKFPRGTKNAQEHKKCPGAQKIPRSTTRSPKKKSQGHPKRTLDVQKIHRSTSGAHTCRTIFYVTSYGCLNASVRNHL